MPGSCSREPSGRTYFRETVHARTRHTVSTSVVTYGGANIPKGAVPQDRFDARADKVDHFNSNSSAMCTQQPLG